MAFRMDFLFVCLRAWAVLAVWILSLACANNQPYKQVHIGECGYNTAKVEEIDAAAGTVTVKINQNQGSHANCTVTLSAPTGKRISFVFRDQAFYFPVPNDDCGHGSLVLHDPDTGKKLTTPTKLCGIVRRNEPADWMKPYYTESNALELIISYNVLQGSINFVLKYAIFSTEQKDDDCFLCQGDQNVDLPMCIDNRLKCDKVQNCIGGSDEDYRYTRDTQCPFLCSGVRGDEVRGEEVCDGKPSCYGGTDESDEVCGVRKSKPFSTLSVVDIVVSVFCAVILIILSVVCLYCYCCPPPPRRYRKAYKRAKKEAARARAQAAIDGQPARNAQPV
ncbi:uncharacterized protein [Ptychodera flava]|uniref:uncharacterized protein n=1 Tax=Ptychodera flava TaxID=63121 RepID=UPI00396A59A1